MIQCKSIKEGRNAREGWETKMMWKEFEEIAGYEVSYKTYTEIIEPMYNAVNLDKRAFIKLLDKKALALPTKAEMKKSMRKVANKVFQNCGIKSFIEEFDEIEKTAQEYAKRFYGETSFALVCRDYAYCGIRQDRGCTFPETVVICDRDGNELDRVILIA